MLARVRNLFRQSAAPSPAAPVEQRAIGDEFSLVLGAVPTVSGASVSPATAMRCAAVRAAVQTIAEAIGQLPLHVYSRAPDGSKERAPEHPVYRLLHDEANDWTPATDLREQLTRDALLWGNGFAFINRVDGKPAELIRLHPSTVTVEADRRPRVWGRALRGEGCWAAVPNSDGNQLD